MNTEHNHIKRFLEFGFLGSLKKGSKPEEILEALGEPEDVGSGQRGTQIYSYASRCLQLTLNNGELISIGLYFRNAGEIEFPDVIKELSIMKSVTSQYEFLEFLKIHMIESRINQEWSLEGTVIIEVGKCIKAIFEDGVLDSLQSV